MEVKLSRKPKSSKHKYLSVSSFDHIVASCKPTLCCFCCCSGLRKGCELCWGT